MTRFNSVQEFTINVEFIETIEETPDTVITLTNGKKFIVQEKAKEVVRRSIEYQQLVRAKVGNF